jgi:hypothetical protein
MHIHLKIVLYDNLIILLFSIIYQYIKFCIDILLFVYLTKDWNQVDYTLIYQFPRIM